VEREPGGASDRGLEWWDTREGVAEIARGQWEGFCGRVDRYARPLLGAALATFQSDGLAAAIGLVDRFVRGAHVVRLQYFPFQRSRAAACVYWALADPCRAADVLRRSCLFAAGALVHLHLESGSLLMAVVTAHAARQQGWRLPMSRGNQLLGRDEVRSLVTFLRDENAGGTANPTTVEALAATLDGPRIDPELLDEALDAAAARFFAG